MDLPKRKQIRLKYYDYSQDGLYFVTVCTKDRQEILWFLQIRFKHCFNIKIVKKFGYSICQCSYYDHIIRNRKEYETIMKYIYKNPINWEDDCYFAYKKTV